MKGLDPHATIKYVSLFRICPVFITAHQASELI